MFNDRSPPAARAMSPRKASIISSRRRVQYSKLSQYKTHSKPLVHNCPAHGLGPETFQTIEAALFPKMSPKHPNLLTSHRAPSSLKDDIRDGQLIRKGLNLDHRALV